MTKNEKYNRARIFLETIGFKYNTEYNWWWTDNFGNDIWVLDNIPSTIKISTPYYIEDIKEDLSKFFNTLMEIFDQYCYDKYHNDEL